jgi:hypothetical protein
MDWSSAEYILAHAGCAESNNIMGVEVDWRDLKAFISQSATPAAFTRALKNIEVLGAEHAMLPFVKQGGAMGHLSILRMGHLSISRSRHTSLMWSVARNQLNFTW